MPVPPRSVSGGLLLRLAQREAGARRLRDQATLLVGDAALRQTDGAAALNDASFRDERAGPERAEEVDLQLERREAFALRERARIGEAHRRIGQRARDTAMQRAHWIRMAP